MKLTYAGKSGGEGANTIIVIQPWAVPVGAGGTCDLHPVPAVEAGLAEGL